MTLAFGPGLRGGGARRLVLGAALVSAAGAGPRLPPGADAPRAGRPGAPERGLGPLAFGPLDLGALREGRGRVIVVTRWARGACTEPDVQVGAVLEQWGVQGERPLSRVLSDPSIALGAVMVIHLGVALPRRSSDSPAGTRTGRPWAHLAMRSSPAFDLAPGGVYRPPKSPGGARELLPHAFTVTSRHLAMREADCFLWHFPWGRPRWPLASTIAQWSSDFPPVASADVTAVTDRRATTRSTRPAREAHINQGREGQRTIRQPRAAPRHAGPRARPPRAPPMDDTGTVV